MARVYGQHDGGDMGNTEHVTETYGYGGIRSSTTDTAPEKNIRKRNFEHIDEKVYGKIAVCLTCGG